MNAQGCRWSGNRKRFEKILSLSGKYNYNMRITENEKNVIIDAIKSVDSNASLWLFGSRTDDSRKGGDIDIAVLSEKINKDTMRQIQIRRSICNRIGEQKIDIVVSADGKEAFFRLAVEEGIELK